VGAKTRKDINTERMYVRFIQQTKKRGLPLINSISIKVPKGLMRALSEPIRKEQKDQDKAYPKVEN
jgi:hypothetical protein